MSFAAGEIGESAVIKLLQDKGCVIHKNDGDSRDELARFDFIIEYDNRKYTAEVKYDMKASFTGNIAIEVYNHKSNYLSGILATQAELWFLVLQPCYIYVSAVKKLRKFIHEVCPRKIVEGGDNNSTMFLYKKEIILPIFRKLQ